MSDKTPVRITAVAFNKIEGIRAIREIANLDLRTAKEIVERFASDDSIIGVRAVSSCRFGEHALVLDLDQVIKGCEID